jgi:hypothetical protein
VPPGGRLSALRVSRSESLLIGFCHGRTAAQRRFLTALGAGSAEGDQSAAAGAGGAGEVGTQAGEVGTVSSPPPSLATKLPRAVGSKV